jgi:hypothetical protein
MTEPLEKRLHDQQQAALKRAAEGVDRPPPGLVTVTCPRCGIQTRTRNRYTMMICECHWLLKVEPFWDRATVDDVMEIRHETPPWELPTPEGQEPITPKPEALCAHCGLWPNQDDMTAGTLKVLESWRRRHLLRDYVNENGKWAVRLPSHVDIYEET